MCESKEKYRNNVRGDITTHDVQFSFLNKPDSLVDIEKDALIFDENTIRDIKIRTEISKNI